MSRARSLRGVLALALLLGACAGRRNADVAPAPVWETPEGKQRAQLDLVRTLIQTGRADEALALISKLEADGARGPEVEVLHGQALREVGLLDDAQAMLEGVLRRHRRDAEAMNQLGILWVDRRDLDRALPLLERAVSIAPKNADYQNNLGFALLAAGRSGEAVKPLRRALAIDATRVQTRNNLGYALMGAGKDDEAWRVFRSSGSEALARYQYGVAYELRGDRSAARRQYEAALAADARFTEAARALARLTVTNPLAEPAP